MKHDLYTTMSCADLSTQFFYILPGPVKSLLLAHSSQGALCKMHTKCALVAIRKEAPVLPVAYKKVPCADSYMSLCTPPQPMSCSPQSLHLLPRMLYTLYHTRTFCHSPCLMYVTVCNYVCIYWYYNIHLPLDYKL